MNPRDSVTRLDGRHSVHFAVAVEVAHAQPNRFLGSDRKLGVLFQGPQGRGFGEWTRLHLSKKAELAAALEGVKAAYEYVRGSAGVKPRARRKSKR